MRVRKMGYYAVLIVLGGTCQPAYAQADPSWAERLRSEALPAWDAALADMLPIQGTGRITKRTGDVPSEFVVRLKANSECVLYTEKRGKDAPTNLYGYNPKYTFQLQSTNDREWALVSVHVGDPAGDSKAQNIRKHLTRYAMIGGYGYRLPHNLNSLADYIRAPTTRIVSVSPTTWKGFEVVEVKLEITPATVNDEIRSIVSLHDPNLKWRPVRTVATGQRGKSTFDSVAEYEYTPGPRGILRSTSQYGTWTTDGKSTRIETERVFDFKRLTTLPDTSEFTLSAYGLPEPLGVEWPARRSGWLWFVWAAVGCVVIAVVFLVLRRRAARRLAAAPATPS